MHWYSVYPSILPGFPVDSLDDALLRGTAVEALDAALTLLDMRSLPCPKGRSFWHPKLDPSETSMEGVYLGCNRISLGDSRLYQKLYGYNNAMWVVIILGFSI